MDFAVLANASLTIQLHVAAAVAAFLVGGYVLIRPKGDRLHRNLGKLWAVLMAVTALTSFFIFTIRMVGPFSPIHVLSVVTLVSLFGAIRAARAGQIRAHLNAMRSLYAFALIGAGAFTFLPGRHMHHFAFGGEQPWIGYVVTASAGAFALFVAWNAYPEIRRAIRRAGNRIAS